MGDAQELAMQNTIDRLRCKTEDQEGRIDRLVGHCAALGVAVMDGDSADIANESWRSLPDDLQALINAKTEQLSG